MTSIYAPFIKACARAYAAKDDGWTASDEYREGRQQGIKDYEAGKPKHPNPYDGDKGSGWEDGWQYAYDSRSK